MNKTLITIGLSLAAISSQAQKTNILFIIADDCTHRDIGCYGGQANTPNIDKLASQGMMFTRCFQSAPMCSPTRHSIYTGQYPVKSGAYPNHTQINSGVQTIVHYLGDLGYRVAQSGKSHVGPNIQFKWEKIPGSSNPEFDKVDRFFAEVKNGDAPFCLLLCSNEPHAPWNKGDASQYPTDKIKLPPYYVDTRETRDAFSRYLAEITYFDSQVGEALALIKKYGLEENTLVVVVSEQGNSLPFAKWTCYDSGLQSIFIARWPNTIKSGSVNQAMIEYVDILPTFIEVAGGKPNTTIDGKSLLAAFNGKNDHKKYVFGEMTTRGIHSGSDYFGIRSVRSEQFKYIWNFTPEVEFMNACTKQEEFRSWIEKGQNGDTNALELVKKYQFRPQIELYDIINDPFEMNNLAENPKYNNEKKILRAELERWMKHCGDLGQETEMNALNHMAKYLNNDIEQPAQDKNIETTEKSSKKKKKKNPSSHN